MIKKYKQFNEGVLQHLSGPSEDEVLKENPNAYLEYAVETNSIEKINKALEHGADLLNDECYIFTLELSDELLKFFKEKINLPETVDEFIEKLFSNLKQRKTESGKETEFYNDYGVVYILNKAGNTLIRMSNTLFYVFINIYILVSRKRIAEHIKKYVNDNLEIVINSSDVIFDLKGYLNDKNYLNESILDKLKGPSKEDVWDMLKGLNPQELYKKSSELNFVDGVKKAIELGAYEGDLNELLNTAIKLDDKKLIELAVDKFNKVNKKIVAGWYGNMGDVIRNSSDYALKYIISKNLITKSDYFYVLDRVAEDGRYDVCKFLLDNGADIHHGGDSAIRCAVSQGQIDIIKLFIEYHANLNPDSKDLIREVIGNYYRQKNTLDILKLLIENGAKVTGDAYYLAKHKKYQDVIDLLEKYIKKPNTND